MQEREISLVDLMVDILLRWRMIIVWMLVGGMLLGAFSYVRSTQSVATQKIALEQQEDEATLRERLEKSLTLTQKNNVSAVLNYEDFANYYNQSLFMQIDAASVPKSELTFLVKGDAVYSIERLYEDALESGISQWLAEQNMDEAVGVSELVKVTRGTREFYNGSALTDALESDSFTVQIVHVTEEDCVKLADQVVAYIASLQRQFTESVGDHEVALINRSFAWITDTDILNLQRQMVANITAGNTNAEKLKEAFSAEETAYYNLLKAEKELEKNGEESGENMAEAVRELEEVTVPTPAVNVKCVLLGMILLAFIYVFYLFLKYILNNKLRITDDIKKIYDLPQLGMIPQGVSQKKLFAFVDGWILKLRDHNKRTFSEEEATGLATVAVKMQAKKEDLDAVYCIGCNLKEKSLQVAEQIQTTLQEDGISITVLNNVLYNQEAMEQLQGAKAVFLLEKAGETLYDEIVKELELLQRQGIKVLGAVVVE